MKHCPLAQRVVVVCVRALKNVLRAVDRVGDSALEAASRPAYILA